MDLFFLASSEDELFAREINDQAARNAALIQAFSQIPAYRAPIRIGLNRPKLTAINRKLPKS
jgi:hypothetical protein